MKNRHFHFTFILASTLLGAAVRAAATPEVVAVFPTGSVKKVQQITARFSTDMTALGDARSKNDPFTLSCLQKKIKKKSKNKIEAQDEGGDEDPGEGEAAAQTGESKNPPFSTRWADTKNWSLDFDKEVPAGVRCTLTLKTTLKDLAGNKVSGQPQYSFSTSGPNLVDVSPHYGEIIPEQYFVALTEGGVDLKSVEKTAYFEVAGFPDKVGVKIVTGKMVPELIEASAEQNWRFDSYRQMIREAKKKKVEPKGLEDFVVLSATRRFPEGAQVILHWPRGILSTSGLPVTEAQKFNFTVVPDFRASFNCERSAPTKPCNPILDFRLNFTRRLPLESLKSARLEDKAGHKWVPLELQEGDKNANASAGVTGPSKITQGFRLISNFEDKEVDTLTFKGPFPPSTQFKLVLPPNLKDELGRKLANQNSFPLETSTDEYLPLLKFSGKFGILERKAGSPLPVSVRNLEKELPLRELSLEGKNISISDIAKAKEIVEWYHKVLAKNEYDARNTPLLDDSLGKSLKVTKTLGPKEFELMGIELKTPGFHVVEMSSPKLGEALTSGGPMFVATSVLVTDLGVHFKKGREGSLVWVTSLQDAKPVAGAQVAILSREGKKLVSGLTDENGIFKFGPVDYPCSKEWLVHGEEAAENEEDSYGYGSKCELFAFAQKGDDLSFVSNRWSEGIEPYRFNVNVESLSKDWGPTVALTVLNRMLAQPGDEISMKHVFREHHLSGFTLARKSIVPKHVFVVHEGSHKVYTLPMKYDSKTGTSLNTFKIPKDAALGEYGIYLSNKAKLQTDRNDAADGNEDGDSGAGGRGFDWSAKQTAHFTVSEYRLPLMKANVKLPKEALINPKKVDYDLSASYLSGGAAKNLKVKVRSSIEPSSFTANFENADASEFQYLEEPLKTGSFFRDESEKESEQNKFMNVDELSLDDQGGLKGTLKSLPKLTKVSKLEVELEYTDPNGEIKSAASSKTLFPSRLIVGLRSDNSFVGTASTAVMGIVADIDGKAKANQKVSLEAFQSKEITHRKKLVGGFYSYDSRTEVSSLGKVCEVKSDAEGRFECVIKKLPPGDIQIQAQVEDEESHPSYAHVGVYVYQEGADVWWTPSDSDRIDLIPEKKTFEPGTKAKFVVRSPFPVATALITIEREGVIDHFVQEIRRDKPLVEVPILPNYAPNVFVSAVLIRGRVGEPQPTALLDLAKPALKMGLTSINVGWKAHELKVELKSDKNIYKTRDHAKISIAVKTASGEALPHGSVVTVAAVDEALLRLKENTSWKLLEAMMNDRGLGVSTSSGQNQVIGKRHFGAKAKAPGGDGGGIQASDNRQFFDPMLLWNPNVVLNDKGEAQIEVPLNDSISSFRIEGVALGGMGFFGAGSTHIESSKDLILYTGFPPVLREGDQTQMAFTPRNTTPKAMNIQFDLSSKDFNVSKIAGLELKANEAKTLFIPLKVPDDKKELSLVLAAHDSLSGEKDSVQTKIKVEPAVPAHVMQATLFQLDKKNQIPVKQPSDALFGRGGLRVTARDTLVQGLAGVRSYMEDYSYTCLEQKISKAVTLDDKKGVQELVRELPSYQDSFGLLKFFPLSPCGDPMLTRYVLDILAENKVSLPEATLKATLGGLEKFVDGKYSCKSWWDALVHDKYADERRLLAMETLSRYNVFHESQLATISLSPNLWRTATVVAWYEILKKQSSLAKRDELLKQAQNILHSRINFQGSLMNLQGEPDWEASWRLFVSRDQEALALFGATLEDKAWSEDEGRLARGLVARLHQGHWDTTLANAWGITEMRRFSQIFEKEKVSGETMVKAGDQNASTNWSQSAKGDQKIIPWPKDSDKKEIAVEFMQNGNGKPWIQLETLSAIPLKGPLDMGYKILRKLSGVTQAQKGKWSVGDVVNVELTVTAKADQAWVVLRDPIPGGASHLGTGLEGTSKILDVAAKNSAGNNPAGLNPVQDWPTEFEEKRNDAFVSYAAYLPKGGYTTSYRIRLNSSGLFKMPPTRVEAMYSPETFGEIPNEPWSVEP